MVCKSSKVIAAEQAALKQEGEEDASLRGRGMRSRVAKVCHCGKLGRRCMKEKC